MVRDRCAARLDLLQGRPGGDLSATRRRTAHSPTAPLQTPPFDCGTDRSRQAIRRSGTGVDLGFRQHLHHAGCSLGHDSGGAALARLAHVGRLIVSVVGVERNGKSVSALLPIGAFSNDSVGDVAEAAVRSSEPRADPVRELAPQRRVRVVDTDESNDQRSGRGVHIHANNVGVRRPERGPCATP